MSNIKEHARRAADSAACTAIYAAETENRRDDRRYVAYFAALAVSDAARAVYTLEITP